MVLIVESMGEMEEKIFTEYKRRLDLYKQEGKKFYKNFS